MQNYSYISLVLIIPLAVFLVTGLFGKKFQLLSGILGTVGMLAATCLSYFAAYKYFIVGGRADGIYPTIIAFKQTWLHFSPTLSIDFGIMLDPISVMMLVVVTTVSLMVHLYSIGYMHGEERYSTYYSFLSLFSFSMLGLVVSTNIFQMYMFWELVGVSSFLLVGFYFSKPSAVAAAKKAFIVTRFADLGFLAGILILSYYSESLDFQTIIHRMMDYHGAIFLNANAASFMGISALTWALCLIFIGGAGKSAMFPLHIWLPDAMEGPTPVSALIHAATMVVAGVFLVARLFPVYSQIPAALNVVMYVGAFSAFFAAIIACTQTDIKRVLAYSTMSQIGYMMFALGVSGFWGEKGLGFSASMFHLFTHAMFKALLFLGAGAVIHYVHSNEMGDMGGLRKKMPVTNAVFLIACLAISGVPPLSGFFSKEEILTAALHHNKIIYLVGLATACLTAFYMFRLYLSIFWNKEYKSHGHDHPAFADTSAGRHSEAPMTMKLPLLILAIATLIAGFIPFSMYISADGTAFESEFHLIPAMIAVTAGLIGIFTAIILYAKQNDKSEKISMSLGNIYRSAYKKFYVDELYLFLTKKIIFNLISTPAAWIDRNIVDGMMNLIGTVTENFSDGVKSVQSGKISSYVMWFFVGAILLSMLIVYSF
ncbi:MAG: NADH-quinone oxidoreductase subunit L [Bacteroidetes bacterium]|nr:NADH-quinone oxidoreductase subunit L [Bacteroidota bacterium]